MASSNRPSKQKRQRQNRQERDARRARSAHAGEATAAALNERSPQPDPEAGGSSRRAGKGKGKGRRDESGSKPARRGRRPSPYSVPGQRAVTMGFLFTLVSAATLLFLPVQVERDVEPDDPRVEEEFGDEEPDQNDDGTVSIIDDAKLLDEEGLAVAAGVILTPVLITGAALWFTKKPQRPTAWTIAMILLAAYIFLFAGPYGIIALPSLIALTIGGFQTRRAEQKQRMAEIRARGDSSGDEVIDVEGAEDDSPG